MKLLDLAAHCSLPPRDGADRRAWHLFEGLESHGARGMFLGHDATIHNGQKQPHENAPRWRRNKHLTAMTAALLGRDYWQFKLLSPGVWQAARNAGRGNFEAVLVNFLYATPLLSTLTQASVPLVVDTHNYDPSVFGGFRDSTRNPLTRMLCDRAVRTSRRALARLPEGTLMVHVSETDAACWRRDRPDLRHEVVENGCDLRPRPAGPDYSTPIRQLLFVGSLSAQMNQNALRHFAQHFWPVLRNETRMRVVGSNPPAAVTDLCRHAGWELRANVTETELTDVYADAHFAVLPFAYGAGSKLKLFEALGRGLPVLATPAGVVGTEGVPDCVLVAESAVGWRERLAITQDSAMRLRQQALDFARNYSWPVLARRLQGLLETAPPVRLPAK